MKKIFLSICFLLILAAPGWSIGINKDAALALFVKAGIEYKDGQYSQAAEHYEDILKGGWESGPVYYNLANSYFRQGVLGRAILNYERARLLMPRDHDLVANYQYALSQTKNAHSLTTHPVMQRFIDSWVATFTMPEIIFIITLLGFTMGALQLLAAYLSWPRKQKITSLLLLSGLFVFCVATLMVKFNNDKDLAIVTVDAEGKFEPREEATTHFELSEGGKVRIIKEYGIWVKVERPDGKMGWVKKEDVERI
jgi:tetratricopeptide (TPR) repeat protein